MTFALSGAGIVFAQDSAAFETAVEDWLDGNDEQSLPALADLARAGHSDARILLSTIETSDFGPSPFRLSLSPSEARTLFRYMDGRPFGVSWLSVEAQMGNELAEALMQAKRPQPSLELITNLERLGERQATDHPIRIVALYGTQEMRKALLKDESLLDDLRPYAAYLSGPPEPRGDGLAALRHIAPDQADTIDADDPDALGMAGILALGFGFGDTAATNRWRSVVEDWLMSAEATKSIADLCSKHCPEEAASCAFVIFALSGGYYEVIRQDTPLETVIPQARFLDSPRARLMALRRVVLARTETNQAWLSEHPEVERISQCAASLIADQRSLY